MGDFKDWLKTEESCGTMGCPGTPFTRTPQKSAEDRFGKSYKKNNKGCSGTMPPCASGGGAAGGGGAAAPPPSKMAKR